LICRPVAGNLRLMTHLVHARKVFDIELAALKAVRAQLDNSFARAVEMIVEAVKRRSKIIIGRHRQIRQRRPENFRHPHQHRFDER